MPRFARPLLSATAFLGLFLTCAGDPTGSSLPPGMEDVHLEPSPADSTSRCSSPRFLATPTGSSSWRRAAWSVS